MKVTVDELEIILKTMVEIVKAYAEECDVTKLRIRIPPDMIVRCRTCGEYYSLAHSDVCTDCEYYYSNHT